MKLTLIITTLLFSYSGFSFVPDYKMIMSRVAENHGNGIYKITQDLVFPAEPEPIVIQETWILSDADKMNLTIRGKGALKNIVGGTIIYSHNNRYYLDKNGGYKKQNVGQDWSEPFFFFRFSKNIKSKIVQMGMAPPSSLNSRKSKITDDKWEYTPQEFLRLSRTGGKIAYAIGTPTPAGASQSNPGIWIEQDQFHVLKVILPSKSKVVADTYTKHARDFWMPKNRNYSWEANSISAQLRGVKDLPKTSRITALFSPKSLNEKSETKHVKLPENELVQDFYKRFR